MIDNSCIVYIDDKDLSHKFFESFDLNITAETYQKTVDNGKISGEKYIKRLLTRGKFAK